MKNEAKKIYKCPECGMHYRDKAIAKQCQAFCEKYQACSIEIARYALELQEDRP